MSNAKNELLERAHTLGSDPRNTNYAGGNASAKGTENDPVTGQDVELLWVKGSGGDLGTLTAGGLAVLRLDRFRALTGVYPGEEREDEMVAAFDFCLHGKGGAAPSIDTAMHALVDSAARRPPPPRLRHRDRHRRRRPRADRAGLRRPGRLGAVAAPRLPARPRHLRDQGREPAGHRLHPRRPRHHRLGRDQRRVPGELPGDHPYRRAVHRRQRPARPVRPRRPRTPARGRQAPARGRALPRDPRPGEHRRPPGRPLHRLARGARLPGPRRAPQARRARHLLPRPLPAHQGRPPRPGPAAGRAARGRPDPARRAAQPVPRRLRRLLPAPRRPRLAPDARRRPGDRAGARGRHVQLRQGQADRPGRRRVLRQRDQRDARRRGAVQLRSRSRSRRSSASSTGSWRRPSCAACPRPSRWPGASRWSPAAAPASAPPPPGAWPPRARAWWSPTATSPPPTRSPPSSAAPRTGRRTSRSPYAWT